MLARKLVLMFGVGLLALSSTVQAEEKINIGGATFSRAEVVSEVQSLLEEAKDFETFEYGISLMKCPDKLSVLNEIKKDNHAAPLRQRELATYIQKLGKVCSDK